MFAEIGFKYDRVRLRDLSHLIGNVKVSSFIGATSLGAMSMAIKDLMQSADRSAQSLANLRAATNIDPQFIQRFQVYAQQYGATAEEASQALYNLNKLRLEVLQGKGNPQPFILTGLQPTKETTELLLQISQKMSDPNVLNRWAGAFAKNAKSLNEMRAAWKDMIINQFGISSNLLRTLEKLSSEQERFNKILAFTPQETEHILQAHKEWAMAVNELNIEFQKLAANLMPIGTLVAKTFGGIARTMDQSIGMETIRSFPRMLDMYVNFVKRGGKGDQAIAKFFNQPFGDYHVAPRFLPGGGGQRTMTSHNNITLHVSSNTPEEFVRRFDSVWKKYIAQADIQFGQQT